MIPKTLLRAALVVLAFSTITPAQASTCGGSNQKIYSDLKWGPTNDRAKQKARNNWTERAQAKLGTSRVSWGNAAQKRYECTRKLGWYCTAVARTCL